MILSLSVKSHHTFPDLYQTQGTGWQLLKTSQNCWVQEPNNAIGHTYRGRAFAKQGMFPEAVADLSAAIHLDPHNSVAFYHRGCLLRKAHPKQALQVNIIFLRHLYL